MAAEFSRRLGWLSAKDVERTRTVLTQLNLPVDPPQFDPAGFLDAMSQDKKVIAGQIRLVLLQSIGKAVVTAEYPEHQLVELLSDQFVH